MKRSLDGQFPPIKRAGARDATDVLLPPPLPQVNPSHLPKMRATDEEMSLWTPLTKRFLEWEENVLNVLAEDYSSFDAEIHHLSQITDDAGVYAQSVSFRGKCPLHGYRHHNNHWVLINTRGYSTTLFLCHHDHSRRVIQCKLPFPPTIFDSQDENEPFQQHVVRDCIGHMAGPPSSGG